MTDHFKCGRNSFDRFCDDLSEELLQYLQFKDKIRLECVSKSWKRVIYSRQFDLEIDNSNFDVIANCYNKNKLHGNILISYYDCENVPELSGTTVIQRLLSKSTRISNIVVGKVFPKNNTIDYDQLIHIIADSCLYLQSLQYRPYQIKPLISINAWRYFGEKRGKTIKKFINSGDLYRIHDMKYNQLLKYCDNCVSIANINLKHLITDNIILLPKLVEFIGFNCECTKLMILFVERYKNTIKTFKTRFHGSCGSISEFIQQLSQLTKLSVLKLFISDVDFRVFCESFNKIVNNWSHIVHLEMKLLFYNDYFDNCSYKMLLNSFNKCSQLKYLNLKILDSSFEKHTVWKSMLGKLLKNCSQLSRLRIDIYQIDDYFFTDIEKYLPKLKWINISAYNYNITDHTIKSFNKLKQLERLEIYGCSIITDSGICELLDSCSQFFSLTLGTCYLITGKTIHKFIEVAIKRPKRNFNHFFLSFSRDIFELLFTKKINFPLNLQIGTDQSFK